MKTNTKTKTMTKKRLENTFKERSLRHLIRVIRRYDLANKETKSMTGTGTNTFYEQRTRICENYCQLPIKSESNIGQHSQFLRRFIMIQVDYGLLDNHLMLLTYHSLLGAEPAQLTLIVHLWGLFVIFQISYFIFYIN